MKRLQRVALGADLHVLSDDDERRHLRFAGTEQLRHPCAHVRYGDRLRWLIAGVPVILMPRVKNEAEIAHAMRADSVPRSMTFAISSRPCEMRMLSTRSGSTETYSGRACSPGPVHTACGFFGSQVSVCAMPPAIQSRIMLSAVAFGFSPSAAKIAGRRRSEAAIAAAALCRM